MKMRTIKKGTSGIIKEFDFFAAPAALRVGK